MSNQETLAMYTPRSLFYLSLLVVVLLADVTQLDVEARPELQPPSKNSSGRSGFEGMPGKGNLPGSFGKIKEKRKLKRKFRRGATDHSDAAAMSLAQHWSDYVTSDDTVTSCRGQASGCNYICNDPFVDSIQTSPSLYLIPDSDVCHVDDTTGPNVTVTLTLFDISLTASSDCIISCAFLSGQSQFQITVNSATMTVTFIRDVTSGHVTQNCTCDVTDMVVQPVGSSQQFSAAMLTRMDVKVVVEVATERKLCETVLSALNATLVFSTICAV